MGISLDKINGMKPDKQFELIAKRLNEVGNASERTALARDLFGKQGAQALALAENLEKVRKKMEEMGALITPEQQASLDLAGDAVDSLIGLFSTGLKKAVAEIAPYIIEFVYKIQDAVKAAGGLDVIIAQVGAIVRWAFNVTVIYGFARGFIAVQAAIKAAGGAMALFNTIVKRSPLFLLIALAAWGLQKLGIDVVALAEKMLGMGDATGRVQQEIADKTDEIKKRNEEAAAAATRGNDARDKLNTALDVTIAKLKAEAQFEREKLKLGESQAQINRTIADEEQKYKAIEVSMDPIKRKKLQDALEAVALAKSQTAIAGVMRGIEDELIGYGERNLQKREEILGLRSLELTAGRKLTEQEVLNYTTQLRALQTAKAQAGIAEILASNAAEINILFQEGTANQEEMRALEQVRRQFGQDIVNQYEQQIRLSTHQVIKAKELYKIDTDHRNLKQQANSEAEYLMGYSALEIADRQKLLDLQNSLGFLFSEQVQKQFIATEELRRQVEYTKQIFTSLDAVNRVQAGAGAGAVAAGQLAQLDAITAVKTANETLFNGLQYLRDQDLISETQYLDARVMATVKAQEDMFAAEKKLFENKELLRIQSETGSRFGFETQKQMAADAAEFEKKSTTEKYAFGLDQAAQMFTSLGTYNKQAFEAAKAFNIANAIMNAYLGATKALATYPPPFNYIAAAATVAMGLAQVAQIRSQQYSGRALGGPVMGGQSYVVGENGPEVFTPQGTGSITRNSDLGGSNTTVNFNVTAVDASSFDRLLMSRRSMITGIIADAQLEKGRRS
jgi:hypothetical protein